jgi:hypothetical protein
MNLKTLATLSIFALALTGCSSSPTSGPSENSPSTIITITAPTEGSLAPSPLSVEGEAPGTWFFEGETTLELQDANGNTITEVNASTSDDWMTEDNVSFRATFTYNVSEDQTGTLILHKANASGLPENDDSYSWTIELSAIGVSLDRRVESDKFGVALQIPKTFTVNKNSELMNLSYWGDTQERDTELYDGISITFTSMGTLEENAQDSLESLVEYQHAQELNNPVTDDVTTTEITVTTLGQDIEAYTYSVTSVSDWDAYYFINDGDYVVQVTVMAPDPGKNGYTGWADVILGSMELI